MNPRRLFARILGALERPIPLIGAVFVFSVLVFSTLHFTPAFRDPDTFYHAKMTALMLERGVVREFPWLPFTTLADAFADHHLLYHFLLFPFVAVLGPLSGLAVATPLFAGVAVTALALVMAGLGARPAWLFALLAGFSSGWAFRLNLGKANALSVALSLGVFYSALRAAPWTLAPLGFVYVWLHGAWPLSFALLGAAAIGRLSASLEWHGEARRFGKQCLALISGIVLGHVVNPYFPKNLAFAWEQIAQIAVVNYQGRIGVGSEWYAPAMTDLVASLVPVTYVLLAALVLLLSAIFFGGMIRRDVATDKGEAAAFMASAVAVGGLFLMTLRSQRHVEFLAPFAMLCAALLITAIVRRLDLLRFRTFIFSRRRNLFFVVLLGFYSAAVLVVVPVRDILGLRDSYAQGVPWVKYEKASAWLAENTPDGSVIFHSDWDDFPPLFFHNNRNAYVAGLDPTFLYRKDSLRHAQWVNITTGKRRTGLREVVAGSFGAAAILVEKDHQEMRDAVEADGGFTLAYEDDDAWVYIVSGQGVK